MSSNCYFCGGTVFENIGLCSDCMALLEEQNSNNLQQLKAKIAQVKRDLEDEMEQNVFDREFSHIIKRLEQLSAVPQDVGGNKFFNGDCIMDKHEIRDLYINETGNPFPGDIVNYADWLEEKFTSTNMLRDEILRCITYIDNHLSAGNIEPARKWCNEVRAILSPVAYNSKSVLPMRRPATDGVIDNSPQQLHPEIAPTIMKCFVQMGFGDERDGAALAARVVAQLSGV